jgi:hypothetical protein
LQNIKYITGFECFQSVGLETKWLRKILKHHPVGLAERRQGGRAHG